VWGGTDGTELKTPYLVLTSVVIGEALETGPDWDNFVAVGEKADGTGELTRNIGRGLNGLKGRTGRRWMDGTDCRRGDGGAGSDGRLSGRVDGERPDDGGGREIKTDGDRRRRDRGER